MGYETKLYWDGVTPRIQTKEKLIEWLKQYPADQWFAMQLQPLGINNTSQSRLYWKWCDIIHLEYGWDSANEVHEYFKTEFNNGESTKGFDTKQWSLYMLKVSAWAGDNNISLPIGNSDEV